MILLAAHALPLLAQPAPQIVWSTNAHAGVVRSVVFSGDSHFVASGSEDRLAKVWSVPGRNLIREVNTGGGWALSVALSSDGSLIGVGDDEGAFRMWRVSDGVRLMPGSPNGDLAWSVAFSPDDSYFAVGLSEGVDVLHVPTLSALWFQEIESQNGDREIYSVAFSPDSGFLATGNQDQTASLWNAQNGTPIRTFSGHSASVVSVDFSPDGFRLATGSGDGTTRIWNVLNGASVVTITNGGGVVKFLGDGRYVMSLDSAYALKVFRVSDGKYIGGYTNTSATCFAVARDSRYFAYGTSTGSVVLAYTPVIITNITHERFYTTLQWEGGSGRYQVERRRLRPNAKWHKVGRPTTATAKCVLGRASFEYRVISLTPK